MTIPYEKLKDDGKDDKQPSAPPDYLDTAYPTPSGAAEPFLYGTNTYQDAYDPESLLPIATPLVHEEALTSDAGVPWHKYWDLTIRIHACDLFAKSMAFWPCK